MWGYLFNFSLLNPSILVFSGMTLNYKQTITFHFNMNLFMIYFVSSCAFSEMCVYLCMNVVHWVLATLCVVCCVGCVCHSHFPVRDAAGVVWFVVFLLPGAVDGIIYYLKPNHTRLMDPQVPQRHMITWKTHLTVPAHLNKHVQHAFISTNTRVHEK